MSVLIGKIMLFTYEVLVMVFVVSVTVFLEREYYPRKVFFLFFCPSCGGNCEGEHFVAGEEPIKATKNLTCNKC